MGEGFVSFHQLADQIGVTGRIFQRETGNEQGLIVEQGRVLLGFFGIGSHSCFKSLECGMLYVQFQNALGFEAFDAWMNQALNQPAATPWDVPGAKQPEEYTWEEFEALSGEHQIAFQNVLGFEAFDAWLKRVNP